jgi:hypothetical protein
MADVPFESRANERGLRAVLSGAHASVWLIARLVPVSRLARFMHLFAIIAGRAQGVIKMSATAYEQGKTLQRRRPIARGAAFLFTVLAAVLVAWGAAAQTQGGSRAITCTNPASGASWQIAIDLERRTVDSFAATISDSTISWRDPRDQGNYTLDRKSGNLTVAIPSSTGGYFIHDQCKLEN